MKLTPFPCTACGECCRRVNTSPFTAELDRGDGTCRHFDDMTKLCSIYNDRPLICRIEDFYIENLTSQFSWQEFVELNLEVCRDLQKDK